MLLAEDICQLQQTVCCIFTYVHLCRKLSCGISIHLSMTYKLIVTHCTHLRHRPQAVRGGVFAGHCFRLCEQPSPACLTMVSTRMKTEEYDTWASFTIVFDLLIASPPSHEPHYSQHDQSSRTHMAWARDVYRQRDRRSTSRGRRAHRQCRYRRQSRN